MSEKSRPAITKILGIALILVGLAVLLYVPSTWFWSYMVQRNLPEDFERETAAASSMNQEVLDKLHNVDEVEQLMQLAEAYKSRLTSEQTVAQLEIPSIGLNDIVVEGSDDAAFRKGPGHLEETPLPGMKGNFAIAGDRVLYGGPFLNLDDVNINDDVFVRTPYGNFSYTVVSKVITTPDDVSVLKPVPDSETVTLITCDPPWDTSHRLVVQGKLVEASLLDKPES
jgi:sortase A